MLCKIFVSGEIWNIFLSFSDKVWFPTKEWIDHLLPYVRNVGSAPNNEILSVIRRYYLGNPFAGYDSPMYISIPMLDIDQSILKPPSRKSIRSVISDLYNKFSYNKFIGCLRISDIKCSEFPVFEIERSGITLPKFLDVYEKKIEKESLYNVVGYNWGLWMEPAYQEIAYLVYYAIESKKRAF